MRTASQARDLGPSSASVYQANHEKLSTSHPVLCGHCATLLVPTGSFDQKQLGHFESRDELHLSTSRLKVKATMLGMVSPGCCGHWLDGSFGSWALQGAGQ